jgi:hypothetical protein
MNAGRRGLLLYLAVLVPTGLATKAYSGPFETWVRDSLGGVLYEMFWIGCIAFVRPGRNIRVASAAVFAATAVLETAQLWHPAFLECVRRSFWGRTLIGTSFAWSDFPNYAAGCLIGAACAARIGGRRAGGRGASGGQKNPPTG